MNRKNVLLSFIGTNDAGKLISKNDGAILTTLSFRKFDKVILLWNDVEVKVSIGGEKITVKYLDTLRYLKKEIRKRNLCSSIEDIEFEFISVIDHNEIYTKLKKFTDTLEKSNNYSFTAAISSGTPAMQVCWILLAESGDFSEKYPLNLLQTIPPDKGKTPLMDVKLGTTLPKITRIKKQLADFQRDLLPKCQLNIKKGILLIGDIEVNLSPMQFSYYRFFIERVLSGESSIKFSGFYAPQEFLTNIHKYHEETFPDLDTYRQPLLDLIKKNDDLLLANVRPNITKLNKRLEESLINESVYNMFCISDEGGRGTKYYGIKAGKDKFTILNK